MFELNSNNNCYVTYPQNRFTLNSKEQAEFKYKNGCL